MSKHLPRMKSDKAAKNFLKKDLAPYLTPENFRLTTFEFAPKDKSVTIRVSNALLEAVKSAAERRGVDYQKLIREAIEQFLKSKAA